MKKVRFALLLGVLLLGATSHVEAAPATITYYSPCWGGATFSNDNGPWAGGGMASSSLTSLSPITASRVGFWEFGRVDTNTGGVVHASFPGNPGCGGFGNNDYSGNNLSDVVLTTYLASISAPSGTYVAVQNPNYSFFFWDGTVATTYGWGQSATPPPPLATGIVVNQPTQGTTTPSTLLDIDIDYTVGNDLAAFSLDGSLPTRLGIEIILQNNTTGTNINLGTDFDIASTTGTFNYATSTTQVAGDYTLIASLIGAYGTYLPAPPDCTVILPFQTCTGTTESLATIATALPAPTFSLANGTFPLLGFTVGDATSRNGLATTTCDVLHVGGCFQNALAFLFYPTASLNQFAQLWRTIQNKPPFGYVSQTLSALQSLNASATPAFSFPTLPFMDTIFTPFRSGVSALLWLGFFIVFYKNRLRHLDI